MRLDATVRLTGAEQDFLDSAGGVPTEVFSADSLAAAQGMVVAAYTQADAEAVRDGYTTSDVVRLLGWKPEKVRREVARRGLYVAGRARNREHVFPRWQFTESGRLPGLREVLAVIPGDYHPLDVAAFMTASNDSLGGRSPSEWLAGGRPLDAVVDLADELGYQ